MQAEIRALIERVEELRRRVTWLFRLYDDHEAAIQDLEAAYSEVCKCGGECRVLRK